MASPKKKKLNKKKLFIFILLIYLFFSMLYYVYNSSIKNIIITGNVLVKDAEIIEVAKLKNYPSFFNYSTSKATKQIKNIELIEEVEIKKDLKLRLHIKVKESTPVFLNTNTGKIRLSNKKEISSDKILGVPRLINYTPSDILDNFTESLGKLDRGIISLINEIEYSPKQNEEGLTIDEARFILYMNDDNTVITNPEKCINLNKYREIYASLENKKGTLNLDSGNYENFVFIPY